MLFLLFAVILTGTFGNSLTSVANGFFFGLFLGLLSLLVDYIA
jgi:hypothetical protein